MTVLGLLGLAAAAAMQEPRLPREESGWSFRVMTFSYFVPGDRNFTGGVAAADRGGLHLEGRYNYEDLRTGSFFAGWNLAAGKALEIEATPMLGAVFGDTDAVAPACVVTLRWKSLELYTEGEYLVDLDDASDNFFYSWSELAVRPVTWLRLGLVAERTRVFESEARVNPGALLGLAVGRIEVTAHVLDADLDDPVTVITVGVGF